MHGDDFIVLFAICDPCLSVKHNSCYSVLSSRFGLRILLMLFHFDPTRSAHACADSRRTASPCRKGGRRVNARRAFPMRTGDLRLGRRRPQRPANSRRGGMGNFPACKALKRPKTGKYSRRPRTGWSNQPDWWRLCDRRRIPSAAERRRLSREAGDRDLTCAAAWRAGRASIDRRRAGAVAPSARPQAKRASLRD